MIYNLKILHISSFYLETLVICKSYVWSFQVKGASKAQSLHEVITLILPETDLSSRAKFPRNDGFVARGMKKTHIFVGAPARDHLHGCRSDGGR